MISPASHLSVQRREEEKKKKKRAVIIASTMETMAIRNDNKRQIQFKEGDNPTGKGTENDQRVVKEWSDRSLVFTSKRPRL